MTCLALVEVSKVFLPDPNNPDKKYSAVLFPNLPLGALSIILDCKPEKFLKKEHLLALEILNH